MTAANRRIEVSDVYLFTHTQNKELFKYLAVKLFKRTQKQALEIFTRIEKANFLSTNMDNMTKMYQVGVILDKRTLFIARQIRENNARVAIDESGNFILYVKYKTCPDKLAWTGPETFAGVVDVVEKGQTEDWRLIEKEYGDNIYWIPCSQKGFSELLDLGKKLNKAAETLSKNPQNLRTIIAVAEKDLIGQDVPVCKKPKPCKTCAQAQRHLT